MLRLLGILAAMIERIFSLIERTPLTLAGWAAAFAGIVMIRVVLESVSSPSSGGFPALDPFTVVHYGLFYVAMYLLLALVIGAFTRNYASASKVLLFGMPVIWLPPLLDLVLTKGSTMTYLFSTNLLQDFLSFFGPLSSGITLGIRIEIALALLFVVWYVYRARKSLVQAVLAAVATYAAMFLITALPSVFYALANGGVGVLPYLANVMRSSLLGVGMLPGNVVPLSDTIALELMFNKLMSLVYVVLCAVLGILLSYKLAPRKVRAHAHNIRPLRMLQFVCLVLLGALVGFAGATLVDMLALLVLVVGWCAAWLYAVCVNDVADEDIDAVSNAERPLIQGTLSRADFNDAGVLFLLFSLLAAWSAGYYSFIFLLAFTACYYVYSAEPLRLKRFPIVASALIALASLFSLFAGYFLLSPEKTFAAVPLLGVVGVLVCFTLGVNVRDLKDIAGDRAAGIATIPTIIAARFGERAAFQVTGALLALAFFASALFFPVPYLWASATAAALAGYYACVRMPYKEQLVALVCALYFIAALSLFTLL